MAVPDISCDVDPGSKRVGVVRYGIGSVGSGLDETVELLLLVSGVNSSDPNDDGVSNSEPDEVRDIIVGCIPLGAVPRRD